LLFKKILKKSLNFKNCLTDIALTIFSVKFM